MTAGLSKREQLVALVTAIVALLGLGYYFLLAPYLASRAQLINNIHLAQSQYDREQALLNAQPKVAADWKALTAPTGNLKSNYAEATQKIQSALIAWADAARFDLPTIKPDNPRQDGDFQQIRINLAGVGTTATTYLFLNAIEKSDLPLKVEDLHLNSRKSGTDDLNVTLTVTTLIFSPAAAASRPVAPKATGDM